MKCGFVTILGRPNVGKSTLLNQILGQKIVITTDKAQTTRKRIKGILTDDKGQIIFVDTPGIHKAHNKLGRALNKQAYFTINDVDIVIMVVDISEKIGTGDKFVIDVLKNIKDKPVFLVINKIDTINKRRGNCLGYNLAMMKSVIRLQKSGAILSSLKRIHGITIDSATHKKCPFRL